MRWLTLLMRLPPTPTRHRVGVWRKLQRMGAIRLKGSGWILPEKVLETAVLLKARSYDAKGAEFTHQQVAEGEICSFVTLMRAFELWGEDPALDLLAKVVNHADTSPQTTAYRMPEGEGLEAIARGFAILTTDDHQKLEWEFPMYDALYAFFQRKAGG